MKRRAVHQTSADTPTRVIEVAEKLAQTRGFNGFSYADISAELGITKASLHYHFPTKAALGCALVTGYRERFTAGLADIEARYDPAQRLNRYVQLYEGVLVRDRMCLCGMLAAEYSVLPAAMQRELRRFFDENERWLERNLELGRAEGHLNFRGSALEVARTLTAALEGAMLLARSYQEPKRFAATARHMLEEIGVDPGGQTIADARRPRSKPRL